MASNTSEIASFTSWTQEEIKASVVAYIDMQRKYRSGQKIVKSQYYVDLAARFGRTPKSFEYRMQNISYILSMMGREWLNGLKPAKNVGFKVAVEIEKIIADLEQQKFAPVVAFEIQVKEEIKRKELPQPEGSKTPLKSTSPVTQFMRDPKVKAWVLRKAGTTCECCKNEAPFFASDGTPFLEVHHLRRLADGGSDTTSNAIAACPNCHRELHYGQKNTELLEVLYLTIDRLTRE